MSYWLRFEMTLVRYPEFRLLQAQRQAANSSMMALLVGSRLAVHTLSLTAGSDMRLSQIFPRVPHIERFDLTTDVAQALLDSSEEHLAVMAVPYVMALHENMMLHCCSMLVPVGRMSRPQIRSLSAKSMHDKFATSAGATFTEDYLQTFQLLRTARNSQIHEGGLSNLECSDTRAALSSGAETIWRRYTGAAPPSWNVGDRVVLRQPELVAALAVTDRLAREANEMLQPLVPRATWAQIAVDDALAEGFDASGDRNKRLRRLTAFARRYYRAIGIPASELRAAGRAAGLDV